MSSLVFSKLKKEEEYNIINIRENQEMVLYGFLYKLIY